MLRCGLSTSVDKAGVEESLMTSSAATSPPWHREASHLSISSLSFADIVRDELLQTATIEHTSNKSLALIQVEAS